jgi:hypothetical protein
VRVNRVFWKQPHGAPQSRQGRVVSAVAQAAGDIAQVAVQVEGGPVSAVLQGAAGRCGSGNGCLVRRDRSGRAHAGVPRSRSGDPKRRALALGIRGWRRAAAVEVPVTTSPARWASARWRTDEG